jgi:hypothetical protein
MTPVAALTATRAVAWDAALEETLSGVAVLIGEVHSRHRRVINLLLPGQRLLALASSELDDAPWTVRVDDWEQTAARLERQVRLSQGLLQLDGGPRILLEPQRAWRPRAIDLSQLTPLDLDRGRRALLAELPAPQTPFGRATAGLISHGLDTLHSALTEDLSSRRIDQAVARLLGLGEGLTPSGDDALTGLLLVAAQPGTHLTAALVHLRRAVARHARRTTLLSVTTLRAAAAGRSRQSLHDLLAGLAAGKPEAFIGRVLAIGHTSGADMLRGIALALAVERDLRAAHGPPPRDLPPGERPSLSPGHLAQHRNPKENENDHIRHR